MKIKILRILALSFSMSSKIFIKIGRIIGKFSHKAFGDVIQNIGIDESTKYNMLGTESEIYYLDKYSDFRQIFRSIMRWRFNFRSGL